MVTIGRKAGKTRVGKPTNSGMAVRANRQLEAQAQMQAERYNTALQVDAPAFYFWHKHDGSMPCSCQAASGLGNNNTSPGQPNKPQTSVLGERGQDFEDLDSTYYDDGDSLKNLFPDITQDKAYQDYQKQLENTVETDNATGGDFFDLEDVEDISDDAGVDTNDPFNLFNSKVINCPICLGTGYIDSWQLHGGQRFVFETGNYYLFDAKNIDIDDSENPTQMIARKNGTAYWQLRLPKVWQNILKVGVYNGNDLVDPNSYEWSWVNGNDEGDMTAPSLETLNGVGPTLTLVLKFLTQTEFTHCELVIAYREPFYAQIPEITQGFENEFLDWNITLSVELPTNVRVDDGDYLTESKYTKVWKVSALTKKKTAGGTIFGQTAELRALHQFERKAVQLALFDNGKVKTQPNTGVYGGSGNVVNDINYEWNENEW